MRKWKRSDESAQRQGVKALTPKTQLFLPYNVLWMARYFFTFFWHSGVFAFGAGNDKSQGSGVVGV